jgi:hypothetical protein
MVSPIFIPPIGIVVPVPSTACRPSIPVITTISIIVVVVAIIILIIGIRPKNQGTPNRCGHLGEGFGNSKTRQQEKQIFHVPTMN